MTRAKAKTLEKKILQTTRPTQGRQIPVSLVSLGVLT